MNTNDSHESPTLTALLMFLAGAATGAVVMALTSPKSGPELRDELEQFGQRIRGKATQVAGRAKEAAEDVLERDH